MATSKIWSDRCGVCKSRNLQVIPTSQRPRPRAHVKHVRCQNRLFRECRESNQRRLAHSFEESQWKLKKVGLLHLGLFVRECNFFSPS